MNIHFTDQELFESLCSNSIFKIEVGSVLYGLNDSGSDKDFLYIYPDTHFEDLLVFNNIHQLQYNGDDGNDYLFISLKTFINNILSGDSTINFDVIHSDICRDSMISFMYENHKKFYTYAMAKSFIGMAKRDVKYFHKRDNQRLINKGYLHIMRGVTMSDMIMSYWKDDLRDLNEIHLDLQYLKSEISEVKCEIKSDKLFIKSLEEIVSNKYKELNDFYNQNKNDIPHRSTINTSKEIILFIDFIRTHNIEYQEKCLNLNDYSFKLASYYIDAYVNWVNY